MNGENDLDQLLKTLKPLHNAGDYVFCVVNDLACFDQNEIISFFKEQEGFTVIMAKQIADKHKLSYDYIAAWITLTVHSSLHAVGLTAAFSTALSTAGISCNVVAAFYHDHIFIAKKHVEKAMEILNRFSA